eukprot:GFUD01014613.1.p1 GENE.GFUD01014613.1~~GFUD01014613.1.p1  ORF type:complete len:403 (-),score=83.69 GFUD01014613.1:252-1460(-)
MVDQFCLKWNNYQASLTNAFKSLLENEDFVDMTLSAGGKTLRAHKVVLSACSSYFKQLLKGISHWQHPVLVLKDVPFIDLYTILEFIYMGEVNIAQGDLQSFLKTAELLQIKGLAENVSWNPEADNEDSQAPSSPEPLNPDLSQSSDSLCPSPTSQYSPSQSPRKPNVKRRRLSSGAENVPKLLNDSITNQNHNANKMEDDMDFKEEINDLDEESNLYVDESPSSEGELLLATDHKTFTNIQKNSSVDANEPNESNMGPNHKKCVHCGIVMLKKNFARHMRDMHTMPKPRSLCPLCQKSYKTSDWLKDHIRRGHGYTKELTDQLMSSIKTSPTKNSESQHDVGIQKLSIHDAKVPPLVPIGDMKIQEGKPKPSLALIDIQSQPMTILTSQNIVKQETNIPKV